MAVGDELQNELFTKYLQGLTGKTSPTQLPGYNIMSAGVDKGLRDALAMATRTATEQGIGGGAFNKFLGDAFSQAISAKGQAGNQLYQNLYDWMTPFANRSLQFQGMEQAANEANAQRQLAKRAMDIQQQQQKNQMRGQMIQGIVGNVQTGGLKNATEGCCFIMLETEDLTDSVKNFRDTRYSPDSFTAKGYRMMAKWLVPKMRKNPVIARFIKIIMTHPIALCAENIGNVKGLLLAPIGYFWTGVWNLSARVRFGIS